MNGVHIPIIRIERVGRFDRLGDLNLHRKKINSGFTLLEVLAALTILATAVAFLIQIFSANLRLLAGSEGSLTAALAGTAIMRQVVDQPLRENSWSITAENGCQADISIREVQKDRTEHMNMKLMEITVDLHWMQGTRPKVLRMATLKMANKEQSTLVTRSYQ